MVDLEGVNSLEWQLHGEAWLKVSDGFRWTIRCFTLGLPFSLHSGHCCLLFILLLSGIGIFLSRVIAAFGLNLL